MEEIIHAFGIDWRLIVIQILNFSILMGLLGYFLYTPVLKMLADRESKIKKGIEDAEHAAQARTDALAEKAVIVKEAHTEAGAIYSRATLSAEEKEKAMLREAGEKIARDIQNAKQLAADLKTQALKESEAEIAKVAFLAAEKVLVSQLSK
ncbi:ATP synthase F0 subunit B [Candidatus Kaiserbacteria bacterium]|nr:MAG: ATP synthase F0 subunit B [Candidatus Kaiserbacteria bacterium]